MTSLNTCLKSKPQAQAGGANGAVTDGLHSVKHLAPHPDAGRAHAAGLPALQRIDREGEFPGKVGPV
jgi:hypothetical protein